MFNKKNFDEFIAIWFGWFLLLTYMFCLILTASIALTYLLEQKALKAILFSFLTFFLASLGIAYINYKENNR